MLTVDAQSRRQVPVNTLKMNDTWERTRNGLDEKSQPAKVVDVKHRGGPQVAVLIKMPLLKTAWRE